MTGNEGVPIRRELIFAAPSSAPSRRAGDRGVPVEFLWVVPISRAELRLKKRKGVNALLDVFEENQHPWIFDPNRKSYVEE